MCAKEKGFIEIRQRWGNQRLQLQLAALISVPVEITNSIMLQLTFLSDYE